MPTGVYERKKGKYNPSKKAQYQRNWVAENKEKVFQYQKNYRINNRRKHSLLSKMFYLKKNFGLTYEMFIEMNEKQKYVCAICFEKCKTGRELCVDHNHATGKVRELLCTNCNTALGSFKENIEIIKKAIKYLEKHG